jgi:hypothetical protein
MQFVTMREFTTSPRDTQSKLSESGQLVVTNNGTPSMLVIDINGKDFVRLSEYLQRKEALDILHDIQMDSVRSGKSDMTMDDIDAEIRAYRAEKAS